MRLPAGVPPEGNDDASLALVAKLDALEGKLHNPKAEVVYDILAMRGGARLYSRLSPLQMWALESNGAPTAEWWWRRRSLW